MKKIIRTTHLMWLALAVSLVSTTACFRVNPSKSPDYSSAGVLAITTTPDLRALLRHTPERIPLVSAHRGGPSAGYPENCIATFENTLRQAWWRPTRALAQRQPARDAGA